ncbi:MAG: SAM-dependent methyltransferase [Betaproteobacteria bacterium]|nr:SAM-dependent methyltransferase [Betaproteobacteria bacterium]
MTAGDPPPRLAVEAESAEYAAAAAALARQLDLPVPPEASLVLRLGAQGLQLVVPGPGAPGPVRVDFVAGALAHRVRHGGGTGQMIARAVGIQPGIRPTILDATAGLGRDAFVLAELGCRLTLIERCPAIHALLADGLQRARTSAESAAAIERMTLLPPADAIATMHGWDEAAPQVVYLDPMFPHRDKSALVKKEMRLFRPLVGDDDDAPDLLAAALALASHRVVVKRPRKAPALAGPAPGYALEGKSSRFDIYPRRSLQAPATQAGGASNPNSSQATKPGSPGSGA